MIFDYPDPLRHRRHGPTSYAAYDSYRPWLRDEFDFRCVYCLKRETWGQVTHDFEVDHFIAQSINPLSRLDYHNLVYACRRCNAVKGNRLVADPFQLLRSTHVTTLADGSVRSHDRETERLIRQLDINSPRRRSWRVMWMRIVDLAKKRNTTLHSRLVAFPDDLPDLSKLRPPRNTRKEGIEESSFARRQRGQLPAAY